MSKKVVAVDAVAAAEAIIARPDVFEMHGVSHGVHLELAAADWIGSDAFVSPVLESVTERHGDTLLAVGRGAGDDLDLDAAIAHVTAELLKHQLVVTELVRGDGVAECLVRRARSDDDFVEVRVATLGTVDAGKSSVVGVLTHNMLDNGRGLARAPILKHQHEQDNGQTSSVGRNILGFDAAGAIVNHPGHSGKLDWTAVCTNASKVVTFIDCAGHEKYFGTTAFGMTGHCPHYAMVLVGAHAGIQTMTKEFMKLACGLKVPMFMVLAKIDMAPPEMRARAVRHIERICVSPAIQRPATHVGTVKDALAAHKGMCREAVTPVFQISNVDGTGLDLLRTFLGLLAPTDTTRDDDAPVMFSIDEDFSVRGVGLVVSGFVNAGTIRPKDELLLGPFADNTFARVVVFSLMRHRLPVGEVRSRQLATIALRRAPGASREIKRDDIRRGMVLASADRKPQGAWQFWAMVTVLEIKSTVIAGYQGMLHCGGVRQTVKIMQIDTDDQVMRTGNKARCLLTFVKNPEILTPDTRFAMREGTAKLVGKILEPIPDSAPYNRLWRRSRRGTGGVDGHLGEHAILGRRERRRLKKEKTADARTPTTAPPPPPPLPQ